MAYCGNCGKQLDESGICECGFVLKRPIAEQPAADEQTRMEAGMGPDQLDSYDSAADSFKENQYGHQEAYQTPGQQYQQGQSYGHDSYGYQSQFRGPNSGMQQEKPVMSIIGARIKGCFSQNNTAMFKAVSQSRSIAWLILYLSNCVLGATGMTLAIRRILIWNYEEPYSYYSSRYSSYYNSIINEIMAPAFIAIILGLALSLIIEILLYWAAISISGRRMIFSNAANLMLTACIPGILSYAVLILFSGNILLTYIAFMIVSIVNIATMLLKYTGMTAALDNKKQPVWLYIGYYAVWMIAYFIIMVFIIMMILIGVGIFY